MFDRQIGERVAQDRAVPDLDQRSVPGDRRRPALLDPGRVHDQRSLSVLRTPAADRRSGRQLHPQLGQGRHRRLSTARRRSTSPTRPIRSRRPTAAIFPGAAQAARATMPAELRAARALSARTSSRSRPACLRDVPHDEPGGVLQQGRSVGSAGDRQSGDRRARDGSRTTRS